MTDDASKEPPAWWLVDRRAQREAARQARRQERAGRQDARRSTRHGEAAREPLTPERIADAALAIIDTAGVEGLTVRALAQALGVGTMTLYWYVQDKDEILDLVADRLLEGVTIEPSSDDWREAVRSAATAVREALLRHAAAVPIIVSRGSFGPNALGLLEASMRALRTAGFSPDEAADAYFTISDFVTGFCVSETSSAPVSGRRRQYLSLLSAERFPNVLASLPRMFGGSRDERFEFGLDCVIEGLAVQLSRGAT